MRRWQRVRRTISYDDGYATIAALGIIVAVVAVALAVTAIFSRVAARHEAQVAADLAAVAAATALAHGDSDPCAVARDVATHNGGSVADCTPEGEDIVVHAQVRGVDATARAGPI